jgi:hypothetical protein
MIISTVGRLFPEGHMIMAVAGISNAHAVDILVDTQVPCQPRLAELEYLWDTYP